MSAAGAVFGLFRGASVDGKLAFDIDVLSLRPESLLLIVKVRLGVDAAV